MFIKVFFFAGSFICFQKILTNSRAVASVWQMAGGGGGGGGRGGNKCPP